MKMMICFLTMAAVALAQDSPLSAFNKRAYGQMKTWLLSSAEKMPEESYGFKPAEAVRSFGQVVGHVADAQYLFCAPILGEKNPAPKVEQNKTSKAELIGALKEGFAYCDKAYDGMTDTARGANGETVRERTPENKCAERQHHAHGGTLRQSRHVHAHQEHRSAEQRAEEIAGFRRAASSPGRSGGRGRGWR